MLERLLNDGKIAGCWKDCWMVEDLNFWEQVNIFTEKTSLPRKNGALHGAVLG